MITVSRSSRSSKGPTGAARSRPQIQGSMGAAGDSDMESSEGGNSPRGDVSGGSDEEELSVGSGARGGGGRGGRQRADSDEFLDEDDEDDGDDDGEDDGTQQLWAAMFMFVLCVHPPFHATTSN